MKEDLDIIKRKKLSSDMLIKEKDLNTNIVKNTLMKGETAKTYDVTKYDRPSVTVDLVIFTILHNELNILLVKRKL